MKTFSRARLICLVGAALLIGTLCTTSTSALDDDDGILIVARANIQGPPGSGISGVARLIQTTDGILPTVKVFVFVRGLAPDSVHGIHIHENGACTNTTPPPPAPPVQFGGAGGHFDPGPFGMSNPDANHPFHMGDLPNLKANRHGIAVLEHRTSRITLSPGPLSVFDANGSAIIVHGNPDQG